jgi:hypothetical protein
VLAALAVIVVTAVSAVALVIGAGAFSGEQHRAGGDPDHP